MRNKYNLIDKNITEACTQQSFQPKLYASKFDEKVACRDFPERRAQPKKSERSKREITLRNKGKIRYRRGVWRKGIEIEA